MKIGQIFRYSKAFQSHQLEIDGYPNYIAHTHLKDGTLPLLEAGINPIKKIKAEEGLRTPCILISSSPHKTGSIETPWQDTFDPDNGYIKYYGDNKSSETKPDSKRNKDLIEAFSFHSSPDASVRCFSVPIVFFKRVQVNGKAKGYVQFQGLGIIQAVELITQVDFEKKAFSNFVFYCGILDLKHENENFNWQWINDRRNPNLTLRQTLKSAPQSWKEWLKHGSEFVEKYKRHVSKTLVEKTADQQLDNNSKEHKILVDIYKYFSKRKSRFELLAARVTEHFLQKAGNQYIAGWITPQSGDHGADFVGRLEIGNGFSKTKLVVIGQAKCEVLNRPTGGNHIARTVARLRRGWIGVYVTTSYFSEPVQQEIIEDQYPIILINGARLAKEIREMMIEQGIQSTVEFLESVDKDYASEVSPRRPEEILLD